MVSLFGKGVENENICLLLGRAVAGESITIHFLTASGVLINLRDHGVDVGRTHSAKSIVTLCDAPGFNDTPGEEVNTANGLGTVKGVSGARSAKILIILCV